MMESIVAKCATVLEFKQQIAEEAGEQGIDYDFDPNMYEPYEYDCCINDVHVISDTG